MNNLFNDFASKGYVPASVEEQINKYYKTFGEDLTPDTDVKEYSLTQARDALYMPQEGMGINMSEYCPYARNCFIENDQYYNQPRPGDIVYFRNDSGEIAHVGIVKDYDRETGTITTIEGNTSDSTHEFEANGGCVSYKEYNISDVGGRIDGFGRPDYAGTGITAEEVIAKAESFVGYEEKNNADNLEDFHAGAGDGNYVLFAQQVNGSTGHAWCQAFVDYCFEDTFEDKTRQALQEKFPETSQEHYYYQEYANRETNIEDFGIQEPEFKNQVDHLFYNAKNKEAEQLFDGISLKDLNQEIDNITGQKNSFTSIMDTTNLETLQNVLLDSINTEGFDINNTTMLQNLFDKNNLLKEIQSFENSVDETSLDDMCIPLSDKDKKAISTPQLDINSYCM